MDLSLFCDTYIIAELLRLSGILDSMPRYTAGIQHGSHVISSYTGYGLNKTRRVVCSNSKNYHDMQKQLANYVELKQRLFVFREELIRRRLTVPVFLNVL